MSVGMWLMIAALGVLMPSCGGQRHTAPDSGITGTWKGVARGFVDHEFGDAVIELRLLETPNSLKGEYWVDRHVEPIRYASYVGGVLKFSLHGDAGVTWFSATRDGARFIGSYVFYNAAGQARKEDTWYVVKQ